ncbi:MAG: TonB family protein [Spirochaetales bacterium]|nr:TonB family protein [Spirochaetales bacterium]
MALLTWQPARGRFGLAPLLSLGLVLGFIFSLEPLGAESFAQRLPWRPVWEWHEVREGQRPLTVVTRGEFVYPWSLRYAGVEGVVLVKVTLGPLGQVLEAQVERSSGQVLLDQAAVKGARGFVFSADPDRLKRQTELLVRFSLKAVKSF